MKKILICLLVYCIYGYGEELPKKFDLRKDLGLSYVSSVKSQMGGTCWTHGTMASIESNLMMNGVWYENEKNYDADLAEYHLDWWNGFNLFFNEDLTEANQGLTVHEGGDYLVSSAYISRGDGPVREKDGQIFNTNPLRKSSNYQFYYVKDIEWFTMDNELNGIEEIKKRIMENGAMGTCMCYDNYFMDYEFRHYQSVTNSQPPNHAVTIVGWDDDKLTEAPKRGAWLCKNSWGEDWGLNGYFWISYYDKHCCKEPEMGAVSFNHSIASCFDTVYYHDYHGWRDTYHGNQALNHFIGSGNHLITGLNFYTCAENVAYTLSIYKKFNDGRLSEQIYSEAGEFEKIGLHTVFCGDSIPIRKNEDFYVTLNLSHGGQAFDRTSIVPVLLGAYRLNTLVPSMAKEGQSYYYDGEEWKDVYFNSLTDEYGGTENFCIKALVLETDAFIGLSSQDVYFYKENHLPLTIRNFPEVDSFEFVIKYPEDKMKMNSIVAAEKYKGYGLEYYFKDGEIHIVFDDERSVNIKNDTLCYLNFDLLDAVDGLEFDRNNSFVSGEFHEISEIYFQSCTLNTIFREDLKKMVHKTEQGEMAVFNNGSIGKDHNDLTSPGFLWNEMDGIYCGGLIFGGEARGAVNGTMKSFSSLAPQVVNDLQNQNGRFHNGFKEENGFDQVATAIISDSSAVNPYYVSITQKSYTMSEQDILYLGYSFVLNRPEKIDGFTVGIFLDWDIDRSTKNSGGFNLEKRLVYTTNSDSTLYYGAVALSGLSGFRMSDVFMGLENEEKLRSFAFESISNQNSSLEEAKNTDVRTWLGTKGGDLFPNETLSVYFALVADSSYEELLVKAETALGLAKKKGWEQPCVGIGVENRRKEDDLVVCRYPNPFRDKTMIEYHLRKSSDVEISIYNILGEKVFSRSKRHAGPGKNTMVWKPKNLSSGVYFVHINTKRKSKTIKVLYLR